MTLSVGDAAPSFELRDQNRELFSSDSLRGKKSLVVFIPFPFTANCQSEMCSIRDNLSSLNDLDANVVAITTDTLFSNAKWAEEQGFTFPVLSDFWPHGAVTDAYGAFDPKVGAANRRTVVLDENGVVTEIIETESRGVTRDFDTYVSALS